MRYRELRGIVSSMSQTQEPLRQRSGRRQFPASEIEGPEPYQYVTEIWSIPDLLTESMGAYECALNLRRGEPFGGHLRDAYPNLQPHFLLRPLRRLWLRRQQC